MIIWIVGLSGSGKTTTGREIYKLWKPLATNTVMIDGDEVRQMLGYASDPFHYTIEGRLNLAIRYVNICSWLDRQNINVICCTICNFEEILKQNRQQYSEYFQVFLDAPIDLLKKRDPKGLYLRTEQGMEKNVVGIDIPFSPPKESDYIINVNDCLPRPEVLAKDILSAAGIVL